MKSEVYLSRRSNKKESFEVQVARVSQKVVASVVKKGDLTGIKVHFGEEGNTEFIPPYLIKPVVEEVIKQGGKPFLFDTNTLYRGMRENARDHLVLAARHGFTMEVVGAPVLIADGLKGKDFVEIDIEGKHFNRVRLGSLIKQMDSCVVVSHVKGHSTAGFGGAIKNISMGFASRSGKQQMHSDVRPEVNPDLCSLCGTCVEWCPAGAITLSNAAVIDSQICIGCGECRVTCPEGAIDISWETTPAMLQEKMAEYALGAMNTMRGRIAFVNFLINITPDCDCWEWSGTRLVDDIGVLSSLDPVAADQASCDLINEASRQKYGRDLWTHLYPRIDWQVQLKHAEEMGVGTREYSICEI